MNPQNLILRSAVIKSIRRFFDDQGFLEMHTPRLVGLPGQEPYLQPFWTEVVEENGTKHEAALITSPEYAMKRLLASGFEKIYDLGSCFRNGEPWDGTHDPEFLLLEWYRRDAELEDLMKDTEEMIRFVAAFVVQNRQQAVKDLERPDGSRSFTPSDSVLDDGTPFRRLTVRDAMKQYANEDLDALLENREAMARVAVEHGQTVSDTDTWDDIFFKIFLSEVEPRLGWSDSDPPPHRGGVRGGVMQPTFLYQYPLSMAALARPTASDPRYADRVELYIGDLELANGFAELSDSVEQRKRFKEEQALRQKLGKKTWPIDEKFLADLPKIGRAAGIAFGVDRLVMLLAGAPSINEIVPFSARERFSAQP